MIGHQSRLWWISLLACASLLLCFASAAQAQSGLAALHQQMLQCNEREGILCLEQFDVPGYEYIGHDEPSLLFYSTTKGSGYRNIWRLRLPKDPPTPPRQNGHGSTWNFQLHPAFWLGMVMCNTQSNPNYTNVCEPDTDDNIFDSSDPNDPRYIGKHPGTAYTEMQFYPPGWINGNSLTQWTAALVIWSLASNGEGVPNNAACGGAFEYPNLALIQTDGVPTGPPSPLLANANTGAVNGKTLFMNPGDELVVGLVDTHDGLKITINDLTTGQSGFMVASAANGFGQILFDPNGTDCNPATHNLPYDFHPMYATSNEHTRVTWTAHSYNIAFSDEIGHFEYCGAVDAEGGNCLTTRKNDPPGHGLDDATCFDAAFSAAFGLIPLGGCVDSDVDFDGVPYRGNTWPGSLEDVQRDRQLHAEPIVFSSPVLISSEGGAENFDRVGFEADIPRVEDHTVPPCQRFVSNPALPNPGSGCVNPPVGADFYPIYTTRQTAQGCRWQLGGAHLPGTDQDFGGNSVTEYGSNALVLFYPGPNNQISLRVEDYRNILPSNPCPAPTRGLGDD
jgi:hypothetical protein